MASLATAALSSGLRTLSKSGRSSIPGRTYGSNMMLLFLCSAARLVDSGGMLGPRPQEHDLQPRIRKTARAHWLQCTAGGLLSMNQLTPGGTTWSAHSGVAFMGQRLVDIGNRRVGEQIVGFVVAGGIAPGKAGNRGGVVCAEAASGLEGEGGRGRAVGAVQRKVMDVSPSTS